MDEQEVLLNLDPNVFQCCDCKEYVYNDKNDKIYQKYGNRNYVGVCFICGWPNKVCFRKLVSLGITLKELASVYPKIKEIRFNPLDEKFIFIR